MSGPWVPMWKPETHKGYQGLTFKQEGERAVHWDLPQRSSAGVGKIYSCTRVCKRGLVSKGFWDIRIRTLLKFKWESTLLDCGRRGRELTNHGSIRAQGRIRAARAHWTALESVGES